MAFNTHSVDFKDSFWLNRCHLLLLFYISFWVPITFAGPSTIEKKTIAFDQDIVSPQVLIQLFLSPFQNRLQEIYKNGIVDLKDKKILIQNTFNQSCGVGQHELWVTNYNLFDNKIDLKQELLIEQFNMKDCQGNIFWVRWTRKGKAVVPFSTVEMFNLKVPKLDELDYFKLQISIGPTELEFYRNPQDLSWHGLAYFKHPEIDLFMEYFEKQTANYTHRILFFPQLTNEEWDGYLVARIDNFDQFITKTYWYNRYKNPISKSEFQKNIYDQILILITSEFKLHINTFNIWPALL